MPRRPEKQLAALQSELDPDGSHGTRKLWAALISIGVTPEDLDAGFVDRGPGVHDKVPKDKSEEILRQRREIREGLRRSRVEQAREALEALTDEDPARIEENIRRFERAAVAGPSGGGSGLGVRPLVPEDVPPADAIDGVAEFKAVQEKQMERVQKDQERKGNAICEDFLMRKQRAEEADAQVEALNKRLKEYRLEQQQKLKEKRLLTQKNEEKRQGTVKKAKDERAEYEDEVQRKAEERLNNARERRTQTYSTDALTAKMGGSNAKRELAYQSAVELQDRTMARLEQKAADTEERLYQRRCEVAEHMENRRQESQAKFLEKQVGVAAMKQEWAENKLQAHKDYASHFTDARNRGKDFMKERSKSTGDIKKKATDKWRNNYTRLMSEKDGRNQEIMERHARASNYVDNEHKPMKYKCGSDVFSHTEVKEKTFGDLQQRRLAELKKAQDARTLAACIKVAERDAKDTAVKAGQAELAKKRVEAKKEILRYSNEASAVFQKIQSEPNEDRIRAAMRGLGFKMPKMAGEDDEEGGGS